MEKDNKPTSSSSPTETKDNVKFDDIQVKYWKMAINEVIKQKKEKKQPVTWN